MPVSTDTRLKIAVFVDFDNIEIGVKTTLTNQFDIGVVLEAIKERGDIISKIAYGDWKRAGDHSRLLGQHAVRLVQRNLTPGGDKNGADINLALDALEMALTHTHINAFVIVGGDSDFISLVEKLKQYDKQVLIVGGRQFTSVILQKNCHEFIAYENLVAPARRGRDVRGRAQQPAAATSAAAVVQTVTPLDQVFPLVERALGILSEREVSPQLGLLKSTLLQLDSTFSERNYGAGTFRDFVGKLAQAGLVAVHQSGRNLFVELRARQADEPMVEEAPAADAAAEEETAPPAAPASPAAETIEQAGQPEDAVRIVRAAFDRASAPRWPMYIRNVRQIVKAIDPGFDERRYGLGGLLELLRACQREGLLRLERDRKGVLRVFQGPEFHRGAAEAGTPSDLVPETGTSAPVDLAAVLAEDRAAARMLEGDLPPWPADGGTRTVDIETAVPVHAEVPAEARQDAPAPADETTGVRGRTRRRRSGTAAALKAQKPPRPRKPTAAAPAPPRRRSRKSTPK